MAKLDRWDLQAPVAFEGGTRRNKDDRRAINVQLATVLGGQQRYLAETPIGWSSSLNGRIVQLPKLTVRVRSRHPLRHEAAGQRLAAAIGDLGY